MNFFQRLETSAGDGFSGGRIRFSRVKDAEDVEFVAEKCRISDEQRSFVRSGGYCLGMAYIKPENEYPCIIRNENGERIGFIDLRKRSGEVEGLSFVCFLDVGFQGKGYGYEAISLALKIFGEIFPEFPVILAVKRKNTYARGLYEKLGFVNRGDASESEILYVKDGK